MGSITTLSNDVDPEIIIDPVLDRAESAQNYATEIQNIARDAIETLIANSTTALNVDDLISSIPTELFNIGNGGLDGLNPSKPGSQDINAPVIGSPTTVIPATPEITDFLDQILETLLEREQAVWDRAKSRQQAENEQAYNEVLNFWSSRGFSMPPGMLNASIIEARARNDQKLQDVNNDILIQSSKLEQENAQFNATMRIEYSKLEIEIFKTVMEEYKAELAQIISIAEIEIKAEELKIKIVESQSEVYAKEIESAVKVFLGNIEKAKAEADLLIKEREVALQKLLAEKGLTSDQVIALSKIAGQLGAAALTSVSASTSLGLHQSQTTSKSVSESDSNATSYSESHSHIYQE